MSTPAGKDDALVAVTQVLERYGRFADFLAENDEADEAAWRRLRMSETSGRPLGSSAWLDQLAAKMSKQAT